MGRKAVGGIELTHYSNPNILERLFTYKIAHPSNGAPFMKKRSKYFILVFIVGSIIMTISWYMLFSLHPTQNIPIESEQVKSTQIRPSELPEYLRGAYPWPGGTYTLEEYSQIALVPELHGTLPGVCVIIGSISFLEKGDFYTAEEWINQRIEISVDGISLTQPNTLFLTNSTGAEKYDKITGELEWKEPDGSPISACYAAKLDIGIHTAELVVRTTSGIVTKYSWSFELTD